MTKKRQYVNGKPVYNPWNEDYGIKIPGWLVRYKEVSFGAKVTYGRLVQYAGKNGVAYPYVQTLATEIGAERRTVERYLKELRELGVLEVQSGKATGNRNRYFFVDHEWKTESSVDVNLEAGLPESTGDAIQKSPNGYDTHDGGGTTQVSEGVRQEDRRGYDIPDGLNVIHGMDSENVPQREGGGADAPPSLSPEPKNKTLAPDPGSYQEKAAREPDAEHKFDPANGQESLEGQKTQLAERGKKRRDAQFAKKRRSDQNMENLNGDGKSRLTSEQKIDLKRLVVTWRVEMQKRFPDLAIAEWDAKNQGQAGNLITKYDGRSAGAAVKYVVRRWDEFKTQYFKGVGTVPTIGMILNLHETIVPVAVQWEKHADTMEKWEKFYAEHPYDDPPAELEKKYRAAKASLKALGLA